MPTWATILTVLFSGIVALGTVINFFRSATKEDIEKLENRLKRKIETINQRIDRHLEHHVIIQTQNKE